MTIWDKLEEINWAIDDFFGDLHSAIFKYPGRTYLQYASKYSTRAAALLYMYIRIDIDRFWISKFGYSKTSCFRLPEQAAHFTKQYEVKNLNSLIRVYNSEKYWFLRAKNLVNVD